MAQPQNRKLSVLVLGLLLELAPAYVLILPKLFGISGYVSIYFVLAIIVGLISASLTTSVGYPAVATALGKVICDTLLGWKIDDAVLWHVIVVGLVAGCAAVSAAAARRVMFLTKPTAAQVDMH